MTGLKWTRGTLTQEAIARTSPADIRRLVDDMLEDYKRSAAHPKAAKQVQWVDESCNRSTVRGQVERELAIRKIGGLRVSVKKVEDNSPWAIFLLPARAETKAEVQKDETVETVLEMLTPEQKAELKRILGN